MRRALLFVAAMLFVTCTSAFADGGTVDYSGTATFANSPSISFSFSEPGTISSLTTTTTIDITQIGIGIVLPSATVEFFPSSELGLFDLQFNYAGNYYDFEFYGAQSYTNKGGAYQLLTGSFPITAGNVFLNNNPNAIDIVTGGKVTATSAVPEPAGLAMLGLGLVAIFAMRKKQQGVATA